MLSLIDFPGVICAQNPQKNRQEKIVALAVLEVLRVYVGNRVIIFKMALSGRLLMSVRVS